MATELQSILQSRDCKFFKARDYHELELLLAVFSEMLVLTPATRDKLRKRVHLYYMVAKVGWDKAIRPSRPTKPSVRLNRSSKPSNPSNRLNLQPTTEPILFPFFLIFLIF
ncbi:hypothetical protein BpHYR1_042796 [Brachionus plicatilis]|uniref:Uncharacterized protein n=1 Tax=Brachionus plicatilis TaxID=10195 RepID=A0A3M7SQ11_BRAPC|nr:hypothetical protein BpHYR1_042796 [Brachionus plicatilis]